MAFQKREAEEPGCRRKWRAVTGGGDHQLIFKLTIALVPGSFWPEPWLR